MYIRFCWKISISLPFFFCPCLIVDPLSTDVHLWHHVAQDEECRNSQSFITCSEQESNFFEFFWLSSWGDKRMFKRVGKFVRGSGLEEVKRMENGIHLNLNPRWCHILGLVFSEWVSSVPDCDHDGQNGGKLGKGPNPDNIYWFACSYPNPEYLYSFSQWLTLSTRVN